MTDRGYYRVVRKVNQRGRSRYFIEHVPPPGRPPDPFGAYHDGFRFRCSAERVADRWNNRNIWTVAS